jgi:transcriptional regulator with XRE-family HTH domain
MTEFRQLLEELVTQYGGAKKDLAEAIGVTPSTLSHFLRSRAPHAPSVEVCLRLATVTGTSASRILRAAGKGDVADVIEDLYGPAAERRQAFLGMQLTPYEQKHITAMRVLDPKTASAFYTIVDYGVQKQGRVPKLTPFRRRREADRRQKGAS